MINNVSDAAKALFKNAIVCDGQLGFEPEMPMEFNKKWELLERYVKAGVNCVTLSIANDESTQERTMRYLAQMLVYLSQHSNKYLLAKTAEDIVHAKKENKLALRLMFQGTSPLGKDLNMVELYYRLGITSMILCYNIKTPIGDGCVELNDGGLSHLGRRLIDEMNRVGMLIDCSHTGYKTSMEALEMSKAPVVFSHSDVYAIHPHIRNLKDDQIKAVAKSGGIIGINGLSVLLGDENSSLEKVIQHIQYISQLVGPEYVGLGLDHLYFADTFAKFMESQYITHPQAYAAQVQQATGWKSLAPEQVPALADRLLELDYSEKDVKGILGDNYLRVVRQVTKR